ncbi:MAG: MBL fold metallo-hydrolase [Lachnospiraceae bacterium]|nr:MBL fold metallo-hydrolase [Lachnospiraceae bacterium]
MIRVTTLVENHPNMVLCVPGEHGLSMKVEYKGNSLLFDTGQTGIFLDNADKMNIDLTDINDIILSHGHYDHTGGLQSFLKKYFEKNIYVGRNFFDRKYRKNQDGSIVYNGNPFLTEDGAEQVTPDNVAVIKESGSTFHTINSRIYKMDEGMWLVRDFKMKNDFEKLNAGFYIGRNSEYYPDRFSDEVVLCLETTKGIVILAGCSHVGIINIVETVKEYFAGRPIRGIIGGTHLIHAGEERLNRTIEELKKLDLEFLAVSHCTGDDNIHRIREEFGEKFIMNITGNQIAFSE